MCACLSAAFCDLLSRPSPALVLAVVPPMVVIFVKVRSTDKLYKIRADPGKSISQIRDDVAAECGETTGLWTFDGATLDDSFTVDMLEGISRDKPIVVVDVPELIAISSGGRQLLPSKEGAAACINRETDTSNRIRSAGRHHRHSLVHAAAFHSAKP